MKNDQEQIPEDDKPRASFYSYRLGRRKLAELGERLNDQEAEIEILKKSLKEVESEAKFSK